MLCNTLLMLPILLATNSVVDDKQASTFHPKRLIFIDLTSIPFPEAPEFNLGTPNADTSTSATAQ